ncbi:MULTISPECIES: type II secretion system protein [Clostridia]|jgi:prepilin-type N-terminal cleavage/methylation domain-containing protein|uniref:Prepilin-type N-terminal cleavage/methylation domain-containing protein n=1 Tax=Coprococcus ammoniilyticus TaxID=2981785 RepID=A0ABV1EIR7_9FIRM|nr:MULTISPECIES: prepilin-type N-terminal cleavage/methylation domain-containing protein [Clostridia]MDD6465793.1 prepilin-type N-terminal cleavage/methylation domain-containing protein [Coprococcus sp.]RGH09021.1 prepilin-type N-terminal cleavage/methylation domain-containing protein [Clostridium sp. AF15-31]RHV82207.1 prepilin-type N-terminal cleavage/methylation domain-containing protein [Clostridium sp. OF10-22XD]CCY61191.1 prepilin-type cleavage/methylation N-terminal domain protein [Clost
MKKNNKGFSLVELIIVIAIMAILAGALAPALIKYINKSRRSADISNADTIRTACQTAMSDEDAMVAIGTGVTGASVSDLKSSYGAFSTEISSILGNSTITSKYFDKGNEFTVDINVAGNTVIVKAGSQQVSPQP